MEQFFNILPGLLVVFGMPAMMLCALVFKGEW